VKLIDDINGETDETVVGGSDEEGGDDGCSANYNGENLPTWTGICLMTIVGWCSMKHKTILLTNENRLKPRQWKPNQRTVVYSGYSGIVLVTGMRRKLTKIQYGGVDDMLSTRWWNWWSGDVQCAAVKDLNKGHCGLVTKLIWRQWWNDERWAGVPTMTWKNCSDIPTKWKQKWR